jgi:hypothetical protein
MEIIHAKTLKQAIRMLDAIGCAYAIKDTDGNVHGTLVVGNPSKRKLLYPFGEIAAHVRKYVDGLQPGQTASIPCDKYGNVLLSSSLASHMLKTHGKGSYKSAFNKAEDTIEVIRY